MCPGNGVRLPRLFQNLPLELQLGHLAPQPGRLEPLIGAERGRPIGPLTALGRDPVPQRLVVDPQLAGHITDTAPAVQEQLRGPS